MGGVRWVERTAELTPYPQHIGGLTKGAHGFPPAWVHPAPPEGEIVHTLAGAQGPNQGLCHGAIAKAGTESDLQTHPNRTETSL
jgi:hypothetical protein